MLPEDSQNEMLSQLSIRKAGPRIRTGPAHFKQNDVIVQQAHTMLEPLHLKAFTHLAKYFQSSLGARSEEESVP
jgi:hypothetical protein